jgi:hypothetical protein
MKGLVIVIIIALVVLGVFLYSKDSPALAPRAYKAALPDLTTSIFVNNIVNLTSGNSTMFLINYTVNYQNIGNTIAYNFTIVQGNSMLCLSGPGGGGGGGGPIPSLNPNQTIAFALSSIVNCQGTWSAYSIVDLLNNITELNENNNNASVSVTV